MLLLKENPEEEVNIGSSLKLHGYLLSKSNIDFHIEYLKIITLQIGSGFIQAPGCKISPGPKIDHLNNFGAELSRPKKLKMHCVSKKKA